MGENFLEDSLELNEETMKDIQEAIEEYKQEQSHSLEDAKLQLRF